MSKLAAYEDVLNRVRQAVDVPWLDQLARKAAYMFGQEWHGYRSTHLGSQYWPYYPDIEVKRLKVGQGRDILNTAYLSLSRLMSADPVPSYSGIDQVTAEARSQFWLQRYHHGGPTGNGFSGDISRAFMDFDNFGLGCLMCGIEEGQPFETLATDRASVRYIPLHDVCFDPTVRDPNDALYAASREYWPAEVAIEKFGSKVKKYEKNSAATIKDYARERADWNTDQPHKVIEVVHYWQHEYGKESPTKVCLIGGVGGDALYYAEESALPILPFVWFVNVLPPKARRPMGRVDLMQSTQEQINQIQMYMRKVLRAGPVDVVNMEGLDQTDVRSHMQGGEVPAIKTTQPMTPQNILWDRKPGMEVPATVFNMLGNERRQLNEDSGISEIDRGNELQGDNTKFEVAQVQASAQLNRAWAGRQVSTGFRRLVRAFEECARRWDTERTVIDVFGTRVVVNDPQRPESSAEQLYLEPADVTIDVQSLTPQDDRMKGAQKRQELSALAPFVGTTIKPEWFTKEMLKTMNVRDVEDAMLTQDPMQQLMAQMGQQGQEAAMSTSPTGQAV